MFKKTQLLILLSILFISLFSQTPAKYWIQFKDKAENLYSINHPESFLSPRAIEKRERLNIAITNEDLPVSAHYIQQIMALDSSIILFTQSKWLNGITIYCEDSLILDKIRALSFVKFAERTIAMKGRENRIRDPYLYQNDASIVSDTTIKDLIDYGYATAQIRINNIHWLHRMGFKGEGVQLMVLDGGFLNTDEIRHFDHLRNSNRIRLVRNFVQPEENPFRSGSHGNNVLSCIASYLPGEFVGTAPLVTVYLGQTEDGRSENKIEEDNWVSGVEWADSLGIDVINSSLGYTKFDDTTQTRSYTDLTGKISRASQAAKIAASKGILICNSAGNEGRNQWHYIGCPAEAEDIIAVGGVDIDGNRADFSSYGPTADGRIKPDAVAVGRNTYTANQRGKTLRGDGTSYASPLMAGMTACLREAFPNKSTYEIINAIRESGNQASKPDSSLGYGITDFLKAYNILQQRTLTQGPITDLDFLSYTTIDNSASLEITSQAEIPITISFALRSNPKKVTTKTIKLDTGNNVIKLALCKLPKKMLYDFIDITITGKDIEYHYVLGTENEKHFQKLMSTPIK